MKAREALLARVQIDLFGPGAREERLNAYPSDVYLTGILFPQRSTITAEEDEQIGAESSQGGEGGDTSTDEVSLYTTQRPSTAGVSFAVESSMNAPPSVNIHLTSARYEPEDATPDTPGKSDATPAGDVTVGNDQDQGTDGKDEAGENRLLWKRLPLEKLIENLALDFDAIDIDLEPHGIKGLRLHVRCSPWEERKLVTVAVMNTHVLDMGDQRPVSEEKTFFQVKLEVSTDSAITRFHARPLRSSASDDDASSSRLIYRHASEYAVGHTCSADWEADSNGLVQSITTDWIPHTIVPAMNPGGDKAFKKLTTDPDFSPLSARWLSENSGEALKNALMTLPQAYNTWLDGERQKKNSLPADLRDQADIHIERADTIVRRMSEAAELVGSDADLELAFRFANLAILTQRCWSNPGEKDLTWRPFQLGFILLSLASVSDNSHKDRGTADLLWFPTGGGKTEAYLGLIAFMLFLRRLRHQDSGAGVAAIMRYTLRLLTVQQFQRATAMICACEKIRLGEIMLDNKNVELGSVPFSIGLWVGADSVPNDIKEAAKCIGSTSSSTPVQLTGCPCDRKSGLTWYRAGNPDSIRVSCANRDCVWSKRNGHLPVWTVDEDIYRERPSLLIGTVDKFAQITRKAETSSIFGICHDTLPPDLIIQDELHLISGPLGTVTGLYETAIDQLCTRDGARPKIIASTATIRQASPQIRALFDRETCLFPPPVIDASNSGFAVEDRDVPGRLYVGITTAGRSAKFALQAAAATLMQAAASSELDDKERDPYWTLVTYFNSLRELGGALVLMQDDVNRTLTEYSARRGETAREVDDITELTSRVSSSQIPDILDRLAVPFNRAGSCDVLLASNMISVGVDIPRLGLMLVNGQPKGIAEYIQATSRVGRGMVPGLVMTVYNNAKSRDRSHYETFQTWHSTLYREVEAASVTPFSSRARDRAMHAVLVALVRHLIPAMQTSPQLAPGLEAKVRALADIIRSRADDVDPEEAIAVSAELDDLVQRWMSRSGMRGYWNDRQINTSLLISAERAAELRATGRAPGSAWPTPNSMRNVEPSTGFVLVERLREREVTKNAE